MKRTLRRLLCLTLPALLGAALLLALLFEVWVRLTWDPKHGVPGLVVADAVRIERLAPGYRGWFVGAPLRINNLGFRDERDYLLEKPPGTFRILVMGDSITFGQGIPWEHTYPFLLEQRLRDWRPDVAWQVWNLGVPGYSTRQELEYLREVGPRFRPDLVVVGFYENDLLENQPRDAISLPRRAVSAAKAFLKRRLYSYGWYTRARCTLWYGLFAPDEERKLLENLARQEHLLEPPEQPLAVGELPPLEQLEVDDSVPECPTPPPSSSLLELVESMPGLESWKEAVAGLAQVAREGGYPLVFFVNMAPETCPDADRFDARLTSEVNDYYLAVLGAHAPAASTHDAFLRYRPSAMPFARGHARGAANQVKVSVLLAFLQDQLSLGPGE